MFVKPGDTIRFLWFFQSSATGLGVTGLTVNVAVNRGTTNAVAGATASALDATNQPGWYYYDYTVPAAYYGILAGYATTADTSVSQRGGASLYISAEWVELAAKLTFDASNRVNGNVTAINDSATAAAQLARSAATIVNGAAVSGTLSLTQMTTNLTEANNNQYAKRVLIFTSGTLINQVTDVLGYDAASKLLTFSTLTGVPQAGDTFILV